MNNERPHAGPAAAPAPEAPGRRDPAPEIRPAAHGPQAGARPGDTPPVCPPPAHGARAVPSAPPAKIRRVGAVTMGLGLIAAGAAAVGKVVYPGLNLMLILRLSPVLLILLGFEVLVAAVFSKDSRIKFDFLSGFVCFVLVAACLGIAVLMPFARYYGPEKSAQEQILSRQVYDGYYSSLEGLDCISSMNVRVHILRADMGPAGSYRLAEGDGIYLDFTLNGEYTDKAAFANDCRLILDRISGASLPLPSRVAFSAPFGETGYSLALSDRFGYGLAAEKLALSVT